MRDENSGIQLEYYDNLPIKKCVVGHHKDVPFFLDRTMFEGLNFEIAGGDISGLVDIPVADFHTHDVDEIYFIISPEAGDAVIEIETEKGKQQYSSPATILIPAGMKHRFLTKKAVKGSFCFGIFLDRQSNAK